MKRPGLAVAAITAVALALRLVGLGRESLWTDEAWTWWISARPMGDMLHALAILDVHPPLYPLLLWVWLKLGTGEAWLRLPSVLAGVAAIPLAYRFAARLDGPRAGLALAALVAVWPSHVEWSQEARSYALAVALVLAHAGTAAAERPSRIAGALWAGLGLLTHYVVVFYLAGVAVAALPLWRRDRERVLRIWAGLATSALVLVPWAPVAWAQVADVHRAWWIPEPNLAYVYASVCHAVVGESAYYLGVAKIAGPLFLALGAAGWLVSSSWRPRMWTVAALAAFVLLLGWSLHRPLLNGKVLVWLVPLWWAPMAVAVGKRPWACVALVAAFVPCIAWTYFADTKEDWRSAVALVGSEAAAGNELAFEPAEGHEKLFGHAAVAYYLRGAAPREVSELSASSARVWILRRSVRGREEEIRSRWAERGYRRGSVWIGRGIEVWGMERGRHSSP